MKDSRQQFRDNYFLWLGGVFDAKTTLEAPAVSVASNHWQKGLLSALVSRGDNIRMLGHLPEPAWPRGRGLVGPATGALASEITGMIVPYLNLPGVRNADLVRSYLGKVRTMFRACGPPRAMLSYDIKIHTALIGLYIQQIYGIPWVPVVADEPPSGFAADIHHWALKRAAGRVFLPWGSYQRCRCQPKLHLDGAIEERHFDPANKEIYDEDPKYLLYAGGMQAHKGAELLLDAYRQLQRDDPELWLCGPGTNPIVDAAARNNPQIKHFGLVTEKRLDELLRNAYILINPRPPSDLLSMGNFPSKILLYLSYGKPIVSTWTNGLSPEYRDVLTVANGDTARALAAAIDTVANISARERARIRDEIAEFIGTSRRWTIQARRLSDWLNDSVLKNFQGVPNQ